MIYITLKGLIVPKGRLEWRDALFAIGISIREETSELYGADGHALKCQRCDITLNLENIGFITGGLALCKDAGCNILALIDREVDGDPLIDNNTELLEHDLNTMTYKGRVREINIGEWFWRV